MYMVTIFKIQIKSKGSVYSRHRQIVVRNTTYREY
jgi:hypothetical protein